MARNNDNTNDEKMSREEAGKLGGEATREKHGPEFYSEIGQKQGKENNPGNFANDREKARRAGEAGGSSTNSTND